MRRIHKLGPKAVLTALALSLTAPVLAACEDDGPMEQAGETMDETVEENAEAVEERAEEAQQ